MTDFIIVGVLVLLNGVFAMSEMAIASSRRVRLQTKAEEGSRGAVVALELAESPNRFLATVQIFITIIGIIQGAFGGQAFASSLAEVIRTAMPPLASLADGIALSIVVIIITYISLVIGELVPKRLALQNPERIATIVARPMRLVERVFTPFVWLLGQSTNLILRLVGVDARAEAAVTEVEILAMMEEGVSSGVFDEGEHSMVEAVFRLDDQRISSVLTPRTDMTWLDLDDPEEENIEKIRSNRYSSYPIARGDVDNIVGIVQSKDLLAYWLNNNEFNIEAVMTPPVFIPESTPITRAITLFKREGVHTIVVLSEYGGVEGLIRMQDVIEQIFGEDDEPNTRSQDSSVNPTEMTISGQYPLTRLVESYPDFKIPEEDEGKYEMVAGFIMTQLRKVPEVGDSFTYEDMGFTVMAMDGVRVDTVLIEYPAKKELPDEQS